MHLPQSPYRAPVEIPPISDGKSDVERREIEKLDLQNILVVCWAGKDRSRVIAEELREMGYNAINKGAMSNFEERRLQQEHVTDVDLIIFVGEKPAEDAYRQTQIPENTPQRMLKMIEGYHSQWIRQGGEKEESVREFVRNELKEMGIKSKKETGLPTA